MGRDEKYIKIQQSLRGTIMHENVVSILMPVYNEKAYLRKCVDKVLHAPLPDGLTRELILVDDASTDGTREVICGLVKDFPGTIRPFFQPKNMGKGAAMQTDIMHAQG